MNTGQRIMNILIGLFLIGLSFVLLRFREYSFQLIAAILSLSLTVYGIRFLFYYFTMARFMVGGKLLLYVSIILLDMGLFTGTLIDTPRIYIILYLLGAHAFSGVVDILRGLEAKGYGGALWRLNVAHGAINIAVALVCVVFLRSTDVLVYVYAGGLAYSALIRIAGAMRRTAIVYIQ